MFPLFFLSCSESRTASANVPRGSPRVRPRSEDPAPHPPADPIPQLSTLPAVESTFFLYFQEGLPAFLPLFYPFFTPIFPPCWAIFRAIFRQFFGLGNFCRSISVGQFFSCISVNFCGQFLNVNLCGVFYIYNY